jgi:hypothetical protein
MWAALILLAEDWNETIRNDANLVSGEPETPKRRSRSRIGSREWSLTE